MNHIEFIGPPGVGKSTIRTKLVADSPQAFGGTAGLMSCYQRSHPVGFILKHFPHKVRHAYFMRYLKSRYLAKFLAEFPGSRCLLDDFPLRHKNDRGRRNFEREMATYAFLDEHLLHEEWAVLDDGIYQFCLRILQSGDPVDISPLPTPDFIIVLDAPAEICLERIHSRKRGFPNQLRDLSNAESIERIESIRNAVRELSDNLNPKGAEIIRICATAEEDKVYDELSANLPSEIT